MSSLKVSSMNVHQWSPLKKTDELQVQLDHSACCIQNQCGETICSVKTLNSLTIQSSVLNDK